GEAGCGAAGGECQRARRIWRRVRDSNPRRAFGPYTLSRGAPSTTRPTLRVVRFTWRVSGLQKYEAAGARRAAMIRRQLPKVKERACRASLAMPEGALRASLPRRTASVLRAAVAVREHGAPHLHRRELRGRLGLAITVRLALLL